MSSRPPVFPLWAMEDNRSDVTGQNNCRRPKEEIERIGLGFEPEFPRNWVNYILRMNCLWHQYHDDQITNLKATTGSGSSGLVTQVSNLTNLLATQTTRIDAANNAIGQVQSDLSNLHSGGANGQVITIEQGTGFASITEENCTFTIEIYPLPVCGLTCYLYAVGFRQGSKVKVTTLANEAITLDAINSNYQLPILGHAASHLEAHITMIKGQS